MAFSWIYFRCVVFVGGRFFGQNVEIFINDDANSEDPGISCAYGPTSDPQPEYIIHCFSGAMSGQMVTIQNKFTGSLTLCDVQVLGECKLFVFITVTVSFFENFCPSRDVKARQCCVTKPTYF